MPRSLIIKKDDRSYSLLVEEKLSEGAQGTTYTGTLNGERVVIKQLNTPLSAIAKSQLIQQLQIEVLLESSFGACGNPGSSFTCFRGVVANAAFLESLPMESKFKYLRQKDDILLVYSFVNGMDLYNWIAAGTLTLDDKISIIRQLLTIVSQMQEAGIIHRDIKPENLMYDGAKLKIIDFGLACTADTWDGNTHGSVGFVGPEVILNHVTNETLAASDIFAAGMTIIRIATGRSHLEMTAERFGEGYKGERDAMLKYMTRPRYYGGRVLDIVSMQFGDMNIRTCDLFFGMINPNPEKRPLARAVLAAFNEFYPPGVAVAAAAPAAAAPAAAAPAAGGAGGGDMTPPPKAFRPEIEPPRRSHEKVAREKIVAPLPAELAAIPEVDPGSIGIEAMSPIAIREKIYMRTPGPLSAVAFDAELEGQERPGGAAAAASPTGVKALAFGGRRKISTRKNRKKSKKHRSTRIRSRRS